MTETSTGTGLPRGFRGAEQGWPELRRIPRPPRRLPLLGDVLGSSRRTPLQDTLRYGRRLGPIFRRKAFGREFVFVWGADLVADLADESRFANMLASGSPICGRSPGTGCSRRTTTSPTGSWRTTCWPRASAGRRWRATTR